jgi:cytochrome c5
MNRSLSAFAVTLAAGAAFFAAWLGAEAAQPAASEVSANGVTLRSVSVEFPDSGRMFEGPGADAVNANCLACHSAGMILTQPRLSRAAWQAEVEKMRTTYKAPLDDKDIPAIVDYLASLPR